MARKGENIYQRKDGRWEARFITGHRENGKALYKSVYAPTYREVKEKRKKVMDALDREKKTARPKAGTVAVVAKSWLADSSGTWKESTLCRYREKLELYILPAFGERELSDISTDEVAKFLNKVQTVGINGRQPVGAGTAGMVLSVFNQIRIQALKNDCQVRFSPESIKLKRSGQSKVQVLTEKDEKRLVAYLKNGMDETDAGILTSLFTGIRIGEVCALNCDDIDLDERLLHVNRTMQRLPNRPGEGSRTIVKIDTPKSACSIRDIPINKELAEILRPFHKPGAYLLTGDKDRFVEPRTMENRFASILKKCGLKRVNYHVTRHTFATRCIERGMDPKTLSVLLGHASVAITMDRYVHLSMSRQVDGLELLSDLFAV